MERINNGSRLNLIKSETIPAENNNWKAKYRERKQLIETPDEELFGPFLKTIEDIKRGKISEENIQDLSLSQFSATHNFVEDILCDYDEFLYESKNQELLKMITGGYPIANLGCGGEEGLFRANKHVLQFLGASREVVIDPYFKEEKMEEIIKKKGYNKIEFVQDDALNYLSNCPDCFENVFISNMELSVLLAGGLQVKKATNWIKRVVQEAYRVVPEGGCFIVVSCENDFLNEAGQLFEMSLKPAEFGGTTIFMKKTRPDIIEGSERINELISILKEFTENEGKINNFLFDSRQSDKGDYIDSFLKIGKSVKSNLELNSCKKIFKKIASKIEQLPALDDPKHEIAQILIARLVEFIRN